MKRKRRQRWIAMLLAVAMLSGTMESTGLAQSLEMDRNIAHESDAAQETKTEKVVLPERVKAWTGGYETGASI